MFAEGLGSGTIDWSAVTFLERVPAPKPKISEIQSEVAALHDVTPSDLKGDSRRRQHSWPRQIAMALSRDMTDLTYPQIGRAFNKDHTSVIFAYRKVMKMEREIAVFGDELRKLRVEIRQRAESRPPPAVFDAKRKPTAYSLRWAERHKLPAGVQA